VEGESAAGAAIGRVEQRLPPLRDYAARTNAFFPGPRRN
jgi:steroid 5-alpha reductase family enzyme